MKIKRKLRAAQLGFSLVEVLISVFIFSVGLLGLAAMQLQALKYTQAAQWRSQANFLAADMVERVRANRAAVSSYVIATEANPPVSRSSMADYDVGEWLDQLAATIPGGDGSVAWDNSTKTLTVTVQATEQSRLRQVSGRELGITSFEFQTRLED